MIKKLVTFSVYNKGFIILMTVVLIGLGLLSFQSLPIDAVPDITNNQVQINTSIEGLTPEEIERYVTVPIENAMNGISGLLQHRSISRFGLSQLTLVFEDRMEIYRARQMVSERLQEAASQLPKGLLPKLGPITTGLGEVFHYYIEATPEASGKDRLAQLMEIRSIQEWTIKPRLLGVQGVAEINTIGGFEKQYHIQPDLQKMARYGLHFSDLIEAMEKANQNVGGGYVQQTAEQFLVQATGILSSVEDIRRVPIRALETLRTVTIGDVADVSLATELRTGAALVNGKENVEGTVLMRLGENSRTVAHGVGEKIREMNPTLPEGFKVVPLYDRSQLVDATLRTVEHNLITGAVLVIVVLLLLLGNIRAALITAVTIPITLMITFILMKRFGISGNLMSLGALDFGIIVDGVVIVIDNCVRRLHHARTELGRALSKEEVRTNVIDATLEIRKSAGFGEIIIVAVFIPIFALTGVEGKMFVPMVATFSMAVIAAVLLSFTLAPALAGWLLSGKTEDREPFLMRKIKDAYRPTLNRVLNAPKTIISIGIASVIAGGLLFSRLGGEFLPQLNEGSILFQFVRPATISIDQSIALQEISEEIIKQFPQVEVVFSRLGTAEVATDPMPVSLSDTFIMLKPSKQWEPIYGKRLSKAELSQAIYARLQAEVPGQSILVTQPIQMRFNELLEGTRADVSVKVFGEDMDALAQSTRQIKELVEKVRGAGEVEVELQGKIPLMHVEPKLEVLKSLGTSRQEVLESVGIAIGGEDAGFLFEGMKRFPIIVRLKESIRSNLESLKTLPVGIAANASVPLEEVADLHFEDTYGAISRENGKRRAAIMINPRDRDTESFVEEAQRTVAQSVKLPEGYYMEWGGNFKNLQVARARLFLLAPVVLLLIAFMIYAAFQNVYQTVLILTCVPLALVGGVLGLLLNGLPFSISAGVGFVALSGIAVLNGVVLVNCFNDLRGHGLSGRELILEGTAQRIRPVFMTALVEIFGFLPMMLATGVGAEVQRPLASVVIGGVLSSTLLTLVVLPALISLLEKKIWRSNK